MRTWLALLPMLVLGIAPAAWANHSPPECTINGLDRSNPECDFGMCAHHPPEAPAWDVCFTADCDRLKDALRDAEDRLEFFRRENADKLAEWEVVEAAMLEVERLLAPHREAAKAEIARLQAEDPSLETVPDYWLNILSAWGGATVVFGMEAPPDLPTPPEAQAWGEEHATDAMRDLESRIPDLREAAAAWREAFDDGAELLAAVLVFRMEVGRAEGDVTSLAAALERCKAAASPSP